MRPEQSDVTIKNLLKQVYAAHTAKVKYLEDEVEALKNKLLEAEKKLEEFNSNCKRCAELEEAFATCKAALEEQSKWFENFGQKFSVFNNSDNKLSSKSSKLHDDIVQIHNESSSSGMQQSNQANEKSSVTKETFLKNLMNLSPDEARDSLDLHTAPFPGNLVPSCSSLNFDSTILAPDTAGITTSFQINNPKQIRTKHNTSKASELLNDMTQKPKGGPNTGRKRLSSGSDRSPTKKINKGIGNDASGDRKTVESENGTKNELINEQITSDLVANADFLNFKTNKSNIPTHMDNKKEKPIPIVDLETRKDTIIEGSHTIPRVEIEKSSKTRQENTVGKDNVYQVSPSLIPLDKKNDKGVLQNQPMVAEDISDFQIPVLNKNPPEMSTLWKTCDKMKAKKGTSLKNIKSTSKFKMSLDTLPPNCKKPNLRQTKLSKSIFQPKNCSPEDNFSNEAKRILSDSTNSSAESFKKNRHANKSNKTNTIDFDATCIPENFKFNTETCDEDDEESIQLIQNESSDDSLHSPTVPAKTKVNSVNKEEIFKENKEKDNFEDFLTSKKQATNGSLSSFDRLPKREEPNYKYKEETVRKKSERKQLTGFECKECEKYFADLGLSEEEKRERLNKCSRHRAKFPPPATPEHFWELDFPDTQECKARGYLNETQKVTLKTHRRRPL